MRSKGTIPRFCAVCGDAFVVYPSQAARGKDRYCSSTCFHVSQRRQVSRVCVRCGTPFDVPASQGHARHCSLSCSSLLKNITHGGARHGKRLPEYRPWCAIKTRCLNPNDRSYPAYGGRGITICDRWQDSFENFLADMGPRPTVLHSIDRIDNDRGYEPGNCRWATSRDQARNTRRNRALTFNGETQCIRAWEEQLGFGRGVINARLKLNWSVERALTEPIRHLHR